MRNLTINETDVVSGAATSYDSAMLTSKANLVFSNILLLHRTSSTSSTFIKATRNLELGLNSYLKGDKVTANNFFTVSLDYFAQVFNDILSYY